MMVEIKTILVNSFGENSYKQSAIVFSWQESLVEEVSSSPKDENPDPSISNDSTGTKTDAKSKS